MNWILLFKFGKQLLLGLKSVDLSMADNVKKNNFDSTKSVCAVWCVFTWKKMYVSVQVQLHNHTDPSSS